MLGRYEAVNSNQKRALNSARVAAEQFRKTLEDGKTHLSACKLRDEEGQLIYAGSSKAIVPQPPLVQRMLKGPPSAPRAAAAHDEPPHHHHHRAVMPPAYNDYEDASQGSQTLLELAGASQISLTGSLAGYMGNSQEADQPHSQDSAASPPRPDGASGDPLSSDPSDPPSRRSGRRPAPTERAEEAGLRKRTKLEHEEATTAAAGGAVWPPAPMAVSPQAAAAAAVAAAPPPAAMAAVPPAMAAAPPTTAPPRPPLAAEAYEEPMGSQERIGVYDLLGSQVSTVGSPPGEARPAEPRVEPMANGPSPMAHHVAPPQAVA